MRDQLTGVEEVSARGDLNLLLGYDRAVQGVTAPLAGGVGAVLLIDPDFVRARRAVEYERD